LRKDNIMPHLNFSLAQATRTILREFLSGTRRIWVIEVGGEDHIVDTGERWDTTEDWLIDHLLSQLGGVEHGEQTLLQVLTAVLLTVAQKQRTHPGNAVDRFIADLRRRSLREFMNPPDDAARKRYEQTVRECPVLC
jgi:hypothetical protein